MKVFYKVFLMFYHTYRKIMALDNYYPIRKTKML